MIWLLLMVMHAQPSGFEETYVIKTFATYEACREERNRIGFEMATAYPQEHTFDIECRLSEKIV